MRVRDGAPLTPSRAFDALAALAHGFSVRPSSAGVALYAHDAIGRDVTLYDGASLLECVERLLFETATRPTDPPPRTTAVTLPDLAAWRGR